MSGGRFLVSSREPQSSEKLLCVRSLIKEDINSWDERVKYDSDIQHGREVLIHHIQKSELCEDTCEVAINMPR